MNTFGRFLFIAYLFLNSFSAQAEPCSGPDIRLDEPGQVMEFVGVRDQGYWATCSSFAASQAYDAWYFSHSKNLTDSERKKFTIPFYAGLLVSENSMDESTLKKIQRKGIRGSADTPFESLNDFKVLLHLVERGSIVSSSLDDSVISSLPGRTRSQKIEYLNFFVKKSSQAEIERVEKIFEAGQCDSLRTRVTPNWMKAFLDNDQETKSTLARLKVSLEATHEKRRLMRSPFVQSYWLGDWKTQKFIIDSQLTGNGRTESGQPVIAGICLSKFMTEKEKENFPVKRNQQGSILPSTSNRTSSEEKCGAHAILITGRRTVNNRCEYLFQNSHGSLIDHYCQNGLCPDQKRIGAVWVDEKLMMQTVYDLTFLKESCLKLPEGSPVSIDCVKTYKQFLSL